MTPRCSPSLQNVMVIHIAVEDTNMLSTHYIFSFYLYEHLYRP